MNDNQYSARDVDTTIRALRYKSMLSVKEIESGLDQFTGTEEWFRHLGGLTYTEGVQWLAKNAEAYWLLDLVASYRGAVRKLGDDDSFELWRIEVKDARATVTMRRDTNSPVLITQTIEFTTFPLASFEWYVIDNVMLLKSEY